MKEKPADRISDGLHREIELRAYLIWESEGRPQGRAKEHWRRAEAEILGKAPAKKAAAPATPAKSAANGVAKAVVAEKAVAAEKVKRAAKKKPSKTAHS